MIRDDTSIMVVSHMSHGRKKSARSCLVPGKVSTGLGSRIDTNMNDPEPIYLLLHASPYSCLSALDVRTMQPSEKGDWCDLCDIPRLQCRVSAMPTMQCKQPRFRAIDAASGGS